METAFRVRCKHRRLLKFRLIAPVSRDGGTPAAAAAEPSGAAPAPVAGEPMDINKAVWGVLKTALVHDGLARGLREVCRALENGEALMCILAEDCNQPDYKKLIEALCTEKAVNLISVPTKTQLGEWAGVSGVVSG